MRRVLTLALLIVVAAGCSPSQPTGAPAGSATAPDAADTPTAGAVGSPDTTGTDGSSPAPATPAPTLSPSEPFGLAALALVGPDQRVEVPVYVAADPATRGRGLMFREELPAGSGMVFLFPGLHEGGFFMKDTLIPLSIAFYGEDGQVLEVLDMEPCGDADPCPVYDPGVAYVGALEVNQGYFDEIGLDETWTVELPDGLPQPR